MHKLKESLHPGHCVDKNEHKNKKFYLAKNTILKKQNPKPKQNPILKRANYLNRHFSTEGR